MDSLLSQVGIGGILSVLVLREVFTFMAKKKNGGAQDEVGYKTFLLVQKFTNEDVKALLRQQVELLELLRDLLRGHREFFDDFKSHCRVMRQEARDDVEP